RFTVGPMKTSREDPGSVRVAGIVLKWVRGDKEANFQRAEPLIREAAARGAKVVVTTECFLDGYAIADKSIPLETYRSLGERIPDGAYCRRLLALADELNVTLVAGMLEEDGESRYNTAIMAGPDGSLLGKYRKQKLGHELVRNVPGTESLVFPTAHGSAGVLICADRTEPTIVGRYKERGAEFLICPSGGMFGPRTNDPIVQARSRENGVFLVFVHPAEFLVTAPDGSIARRVLLGDRLLVGSDDRDTSDDSREVVLFNLPLKTSVTP
ncbi:MAG: carbon-nitrogen hydrolase family protein, partial [Isosphaeraceae bacterium]